MVATVPVGQHWPNWGLKTDQSLHILQSIFWVTFQTFGTDHSMAHNNDNNTKNPPKKTPKNPKPKQTNKKTFLKRQYYLDMDFKPCRSRKEVFSNHRPIFILEDRNEAAMSWWPMAVSHGTRAPKSSRAFFHITTLMQVPPTALCSVALTFLNY